MSRRGWTVLLSVLIVVSLAVVGAFVQVPYVALGPGPTYDTLGSVDGKVVVSVTGGDTYPTDGQLRMTTVSLTDRVSLLQALGMWVSGRYAIAPREDYIQPGESEQDVEKRNTQMFKDSQTNAEVAALRLLHYPIKVLAQEITDGAPADHVITPGDQLLEVNGTKINVQEDVRNALKGTHPGQVIPITFQHENQAPQTATVTLGKASDYGADDRAEGFMGLAPVDRAQAPALHITIQLQDVGGPSAGLMFALAIYDRLTNGALPDGRVIAGTGEIDVKGNVSPIGGIPFKMVAAREAGATEFLVPKDNCAEAKEHIPDGLQLIKVESLDGAVQALRDLDAHRPTPAC